MESVEAGLPVHVERDHILRVKIIDSCGMSCTFCHNEGTPVASEQRRGLALRAGEGSGRVSIYAASNGVRFLPAPMRADAHFATALAALRSALDVSEVLFTGGEPTLHPQLVDLIKLARDLDLAVSMTSNGENGQRVLPGCAQAGLYRVNFSIFGSTPGDLAEVQSIRYRRRQLAARKMAALHNSILSCHDLGISTSANIVVPSYEHKERVLRLLEKYSDVLSVRLLNSLSDGEISVSAILRILDDLHARPVARYMTAGTSGARTAYLLPAGRTIYFKEIRHVRLPVTCRNCRFNNDRDCHEGYYGVRLYRDADGRYLVGVCIQRMDLCVPVEEFVTSDLRREILQLRDDEFAALAGGHDRSKIVQ